MTNQADPDPTDVKRTLTPGPTVSIDGQLTPEQYSRAQSWLDAHWKTSECPFHGPTTWALGDVMAAALAYVPVGGQSINKVYPLVVLTCNTCGYTVFVNAIRIGLTQPETPLQPASAEAD